MNTQQERINNSNLLSKQFDQRKRLSQTMGSVNGMLKVKLGRPVLKLLFLIIYVLGIKRNIGVVKVLITYASAVYRLMRKGGPRFTVIYLKACTSLLQQSIGGQVLPDTGPFGARVSRTRGGLPRIIPALHRKRIRKGELLIIRLWLSLFSMYRILDLSGKVNLETIRAPSTADLSLEGEFKQFVDHFWSYVGRKWNVPKSIASAVGRPISFLSGLGVRPFLSASSGPILSGTLSREKVDGTLVKPRKGERPAGARMSSFSALGIIMAAHLWREPNASLMLSALMRWCMMTGNFNWWGGVISGWKPSGSFANLVDYIKDPKNVFFNPSTGAIRHRSDLTVKETSGKTWKAVSFKLKWFLGKLGFKQEAAGKVRVFAMVDPITQWILAPLHNAIFLLLEVIPQDGTHDQLKPVVRLLDRQRALLTKGKTSRVRKDSSLFSFDLSSATDRLPVIFQRWLLEPVITIAGASHWATFLVGRAYLAMNRPDVGLRTTSPGIEVRYATGQPMGALSSWAMLALTHHCIVQWAWWRVCRASGVSWSWFQDYAVLGDDVVIMGDRVARSYVKIISSLGVDISGHKSLLSKRGTCLEFAKRTFLRGVDVSAVPLIELRAATKNIGAVSELVRKYNLTLGRYLSFLGFGYRAKGSAAGLINQLPFRLRQYMVIYFGPGSPSFGGFLNWISMRTIGSKFKATEEGYRRLKAEFMRREKSKLRDLFDSMSTVFSKAIAFWGPPIVVDEKGIPLPGQTRKFSLVSDNVDQDTILRLDNDVFVPLRNKTLMKAFNLQNRVMSIDSSSSMEDLELIWESCRELDGDLGALPLPSDSVIAKVRSDLAKPKAWRQWLMYSDLLQKTLKV